MVREPAAAERIGCPTPEERRGNRSRKGAGTRTRTEEPHVAAPVVSAVSIRRSARASARAGGDQKLNGGSAPVSGNADCPRGGQVLRLSRAKAVTISVDNACAIA